MKVLGIATLLLAAAFGLGSCSEQGEAGENAKRLELLTWWIEPSERAAIDALVEVHRERHPDVDVTVLASGTRATMVNELRDRLAQGNPPTAFQENLGGRARAWAESAQPLNDHSRSWASSYEPEVLDLVTSDGQLLGVPLAITRQNNAYYNARLLDELDLEVPRGVEEFEEWLEELAEAGYEHPLCIGDVNNWVSAHVLFENLLPAHAGAEFSRAYWSGERSPDDPLFIGSLEYAASVVGYFNEDFADIDMSPGITRVMEDRPRESQCLMAPMGDWGGAILAAEFEIGEDFVQQPWPGTEDIFVLAGDAFITARGVKNQQEVYAFFDTLASREGQIAFNSKKGSVPARTMDPADIEAFGALTQQNMRDLASGTPVAAFQVLGPGDFPWESLYVLAHDFFLARDPTPLVDFMKGHYSELGQ